MKKLDPDFIKQQFELKGWQLHDKYQNSRTIMNSTCTEGHNTQISWNNFQKGQGCKYCAGNVKFTYEEVKQYFEEQGCELLEETYEASVLPLNYRCSCGNMSKIDFGNFRLGRRCQQCGNNKISEKLKTKDEEIIKLCTKNKCKFIRSWIQDKRTRIEYICKCGNQIEAYLSNFKRFPNCKKCGNKKVSGSNCYMYDPDREAVAMRRRFSKICGQHIRRFMKATGQKKTRSTHELLGYKPADLQEHILNHPNMKNCGDDWHVDHIFPIKAFLDHGILDLSLINKLDNLQPLPGPENLSKANDYDEKEFLMWLNEEKRTDYPPEPKKPDPYPHPHVPPKPKPEEPPKEKDCHKTAHV